MITDTTGGSRDRFDEKNIYGDVQLLMMGLILTLNEITINFKSKQDNYQDDQVFLNYC